MTSRGSRHRGGPPRRPVTSSALRRTVLVFTEGEKTEVQYLLAWYRRNRQQVLLAIDDRHGYSPLDMVQFAVEARKKDRQAERRGEGAAWTEIWCVFDTDQHANLDQARALAEGNGLKVALSNPCFELWLILHDRDQRAWISGPDAQSLSKSIFGTEKALSSEIADNLIDRLDDAIARAKQLDAKHQGDGSPVGENPSSGMWQLMESLGM